MHLLWLLNGVFGASNDLSGGIFLLWHPLLTWRLHQQGASQRGMLGIPPQRTQGASTDVKALHSTQTGTRVSTAHSIARLFPGINRNLVPAIMSLTRGDLKRGRATLVTEYLSACIFTAVYTASDPKVSAADHAYPLWPLSASCLTSKHIVRKTRHPAMSTKCRGP